MDSIPKINGDAGCRFTIDSLIADYYCPLSYFAMKLTGDMQTAEDIVQDAFVNLIERRGKVNDIRHARNLLYMMVHNYAVNYLKGAARRGHTPLAADPADEGDLWVQYVGAETNRMLHEAVGKLPERIRDVMELTLGGMRQEAIAKQMGLALVTVKARKAEGIKRLRKLLGPLALFGF